MLVTAKAEHIPKTCRAIGLSLKSGANKTSEALEKTRVGIWDNENLYYEKLGPVMEKESKLLKRKFNF